MEDRWRRVERWRTCMLEELAGADWSSPASVDLYTMGSPAVSALPHGCVGRTGLAGSRPAGDSHHGQGFPDPATNILPILWERKWGGEGQVVAGPGRRCSLARDGPGGFQWTVG